jgi:hypothetical protein
MKLDLLHGQFVFKCLQLNCAAVSSDVDDYPEVTAVILSVFLHMTGAH